VELGEVPQCHQQSVIDSHYSLAMCRAAQRSTVVRIVSVTIHLHMCGLARLPGYCCSSGIGRGPPVSPAVSNRQSPFPRNVPSRSTFHSGQNRQRNHTPSYGQTTPMQTQDTSAISHTGRTSSFFSKLSSRFSKR